VDEKLKVLMQELGNAINESLSDSDRIAAAIGEIRRAGYDVFLVLEATIGFNKREEASDEELAQEGENEERPRRASVREFGGSTKIKWTSQDQKFLRALKIAVDDDSR
jgi:enamine deaminase RidA (YjgF/YER057c/UK114 family)